MPPHRHRIWIPEKFCYYPPPPLNPFGQNSVCPPPQNGCRPVRLCWLGCWTHDSTVVDSIPTSAWSFTPICRCIFNLTSPFTASSPGMQFVTACDVNYVTGDTYFSAQFSDHAVPLARAYLRSVLVVFHQAYQVIESDNVGDLLCQVCSVTFEAVIANQWYSVIRNPLQHEVGIRLKRTATHSQFLVIYSKQPIIGLTQE